jgi:hypothetical protein
MGAEPYAAPCGIPDYNVYRGLLRLCPIGMLDGDRTATQRRGGSMEMPAWEILLIVIGVVLAAVGVWLVLSRRRSSHLRSRFGPEYERALSESGDRGRAERELERREKRVERLHIHALDPRDRNKFVAAWRKDQARFVDDPAGAVTEADRLVQEVMTTRGYPTADFDRRVEDISVDHPHLVKNYRAARELAERNRRGDADTEELRKALVYYRALFEDLLEEQGVSK